jgi:hypothetical protein
MARTSDALVEDIIEVDSDISLTPFITVANSMVTQFCVDDDATNSAAQLILIETWLSAHFYCIRDKRAEQEKADVVSAKYQGKTDMYLDSSDYGQTAMQLDYTNGLSAMNKALKNGSTAVRAMGAVTWVGTDEEDLD